MSEDNSDTESETGAVKYELEKDTLKEQHYTRGVRKAQELEQYLVESQRSSPINPSALWGQRADDQYWAIVSTEYINCFYRSEQRAAQKSGGGPSDSCWGNLLVEKHMATRPMSWRMVTGPTGLTLTIAPFIHLEFREVINPKPTSWLHSLQSKAKPGSVTLRSDGSETGAGRGTEIDITMLSEDCCKIEIELRHLRPDKPEFKDSTRKIAFYGYCPFADRGLSFLQSLGVAIDFCLFPFTFLNFIAGSALHNL